jgi:predicted kinase
MARLSLIIGPVGAGKSTYGIGLCQKERAVRLTLDEWMATLYGADERPTLGRREWYVERSERCIAQMWPLAVRLLDLGTNVVMEIGLIRRSAREAFYRRVDDAGAELTVHVVDAPREVRRERVMRRNVEQGATFSMVVPADFFELASDLWEAPDEGEREGREVRFGATG